MKRFYRTVIAAWLSAVVCLAADPTPLNDRNFQERVSGLAGERNEAQRLQRAKDLLSRYRLSSLQIKAVAARLGDDSARLEFATLAYPNTVDPENFYEVYDAFTTFSKVMRLHDRIQPLLRLPEAPAPVAAVPQAVTEEEMKPILETLRKESFEQTRSQVARQLLEGRQRRFLAAQIKQMLDCFTFEPSKLELAKYAYDYTLDRENYFVVNDALTFANSKENLALYIKSRNQAPFRP